MGPERNRVAVFLGFFFLLAGWLVSAPPAGAVSFAECPPTGLNTGCRLEINISSTATVSILTDAAQSATFDGSEDTLIGVRNNSSLTIPSLTLTSASLNIFGFDGDGICAQSPQPAGCPFGPTGYEGPGVSFTGINAAQTVGNVVFAGGLTPGATAFFGLEEPLSSASFQVSGPGIVTPEPATLLLVGSALVGVGARARRRRHL